MATQRYSLDIKEAGQNWVPRPTLSSADYASLEVWEAERERIWWGDWVCIGRSTEIEQPGEYIVRDLAGESIFLVRNLKGEVRGFYNVCSHRGTKFLDDCEGTGQAKKAFKCPYHAWSFDLDGNLIASPNVHEDDAFDRSDYPLYGFAVDEYAGFLFVNLTKGPVRPLLDALMEGAETITAYERYRMDELRLGHRIVYEVKANWKIVVENYNECLHCPQIHPELVSVIPLYRFGEVWDDDSGDVGNRMVDEATNFSVNGKSSLPRLPGLDPDDYHMYQGSYEFPNLMVNLHPDGMMSYIAMPKGPNHTTVDLGVLLPAGDHRRARTSIRPGWSSSGISSASRIGRSSSGPRPASRHEPSPAASSLGRTASCTGSTRNGGPGWVANAWAEVRSIASSRSERSRSWRFISSGVPMTAIRPWSMTQIRSASSASSR